MELDEQTQAVAETLASEMLSVDSFQSFLVDAESEHERVSLIAAYVIHRFRDQQ